MKTIVFCSMVSLCAGVAASEVMAQDDQRQGVFESSDSTIQVFRPESARPTELVSRLKQLNLGVRMVGDNSSNTIVVSGPEARVIDTGKLIAELDAEANDRRTRAEFLQLKHRKASEAARLLNDAIAQYGNTRISVDEPNRTLVISAAKAELERARSLLSKIDTPRSSLMMRFHFIRGRIDRGGGVSGGTLPAEMSGVLSALNQQGVMDVSLLAPMTVRSWESADFAVNGTTVGPDGVGREFSVHGEVQQMSADDSARLKVASQVIRRPPGSPPQVLFEVGTTLEIPVGEYIVLAAAPVSLDADEVIALAVSVSTGM